MVVHASRRPRFSVSRRRRRSRRGGIRAVTGGIGSSFRSLMDKQTLTIAGGAVASGFLSGYILNKFGSGAVAAGGFSLPGSGSTYGKIFYQLAIPIGGAYLVKRFSPDLAKGMLLGGVIAAIQSGLAIAMGSGGITGTSEYLSAMRPVAALPPGYSAVDTFGSIYSSDAAFAGSAWGN